MKTVDEIFDFLVRNSAYYINFKQDDFVSKIIKDIRSDKFEEADKNDNLFEIFGWDRITLIVDVNHIPAFHCDLEKFEAFVGESYSYKKHIKPLEDAKLIRTTVNNDPNNFYNSKEYQKFFDGTNGLVGEDQKSFVRFWLGATNPNDDF